MARSGLRSAHVAGALGTARNDSRRKMFAHGPRAYATSTLLSEYDFLVRLPTHIDVQFSHLSPFR